MKRIEILIRSDNGKGVDLYDAADIFSIFQDEGDFVTPRINTHGCPLPSFSAIYHAFLQIR